MLIVVLSTLSLTIDLVKGPLSLFAAAVHPGCGRVQLPFRQPAGGHAVPGGGGLLVRAGGGKDAVREEAAEGAARLHHLLPAAHEGGGRGNHLL